MPEAPDLTPQAILKLYLCNTFQAAGHKQLLTTIQNEKPTNSSNNK